MKVSVIIPTYNEKQDIVACINSLKKQNFDDYELIVVDDGSTDGTVKIIKELNIKYFSQNHSGAGQARNLGARHSKGTVLVFVDADMTFDKSFLKDLTKPIMQGKAKGTFSKNEFVSNWNNVWARCYNWNQNWQDKRRHAKSYPDEQKVFRAILSSEFESVGGFDKGGYTDDWSLSEKLGYNAKVAKGAMFYHRNPSSLAEVFKHTQWVGQRKHKFGIIGFIFAVIRASLPVSLSIGVIKSFIHQDLRFLIFKLVYDFALIIGIIRFNVGLHSGSRSSS